MDSYYLLLSLHLCCIIIFKQYAITIGNEKIIGKAYLTSTTVPAIMTKSVNTKGVATINHYYSPSQQLFVQSRPAFYHNT